MVSRDRSANPSRARVVIMTYSLQERAEQAFAWPFGFHRVVHRLWKAGLRTTARRRIFRSIYLLTSLLICTPTCIPMHIPYPRHLCTIMYPTIQAFPLFPSPSLAHLTPQSATYHIISHSSHIAQLSIHLSILVFFFSTILVNFQLNFHAAHTPALSHSYPYLSFFSLNLPSPHHALAIHL